MPMRNQSDKKAMKRILAGIFLACFLAVSLLTSVLIWAHVGHQHRYEEVYGSCVICTQIQVVEKIRKQLSTAMLGGALFSFAGAFTFFILVKAICFVLSFSTPVTSKVRMNN